MALHIGTDTTLTNSSEVVPPNNGIQQPTEVRIQHGPGYVTHLHPRPMHNGEPIIPTNFETVYTYSQDYQFGPFPSYMPKTEDNIRRLYPETKRNLRKIVEPVQPDPRLTNMRVSPKPPKADRVFNTIKTLTDVSVAIIDHDNVNDLFFSQRNLQTGFDNVIDDSDFHTPCRQTYIFNSMQDHIPYVLYPDNTPSTVQNKDFSGMSDVNKKYLCEMFSTETKKITNLDGVFIIEYKEIIVPRYNGIKYSTKHIMEYYKNSIDIYPGCKFLTSKPNEPNQTAGKALYDRMQVHQHYNNELNGHSIYRVVTFIPKKDLEDNIEVYVQHLGLVIGIGEIQSRTVHPTYQPYIEYHRNIGLNCKNGMHIEINDPNNINKEYYYKVGKEIIKIKSSNDPNSSSGATIKQYVNGAMIKHICCELDDMEEKLGIYDTYDAALNDGDFKFKYEQLCNERKLELDEIRIDNETKKIKIERTKQTTEYLKTIPAVLGGVAAIVGLFLQLKRK